VAESAFAVHVPEAEALVGALRWRYDGSFRLGVPAHVTVLYPFMDPRQIDIGIIRTSEEVLRKHRSFSFQLGTVGRFPATAYLEPKPSEPFIALTESLVKAFPAYLPFRGEFPTIVPHLTVANGSAAEAEFVEAELSVALASVGALRAACTSVVLMENSSGYWRSMHVFPLSSATGT
jgi:2'-5' RNA ligase